MSTTLSKLGENPSTVIALMAAGKMNKARGERIERLMDSQGWKPAHLARVMGVDRKRIYGWKAGESIGSDSLERLAIALESTRLYIESGEGPPQYPRGGAPALLLRQLLDGVAEPNPTEG